MLYYLRRAKGVFWGASEIARQRNFATQVQFTSLTKGTSKIPLVSRKEILGQKNWKWGLDFLTNPQRMLLKYILS